MSFPKKYENDNQLELAYFSRNLKYFDQLLQTDKNETYCSESYFQSFYKNQIVHWFPYFMQKTG